MLVNNANALEAAKKYAELLRQDLTNEKDQRALDFLIAICDKTPGNELYKNIPALYDEGVTYLVNLVKSCQDIKIDAKHNAATFIKDKIQSYAETSIKDAFSPIKEGASDISENEIERLHMCFELLNKVNGVVIQQHKIYQDNNRAATNALTELTTSLRAVSNLLISTPNVPIAFSLDENKKRLKLIKVFGKVDPSLLRILKKKVDKYIVTPYSGNRDDLYELINIVASPEQIKEFARKRLSYLLITAPVDPKVLGSGSFQKSGNFALSAKDTQFFRENRDSLRGVFTEVAKEVVNDPQACKGGYWSIALSNFLLDSVEPVITEQYRLNYSLQLISYLTTENNKPQVDFESLNKVDGIIKNFLSYLTLKGLNYPTFKFISDVTLIKKFNGKLTGFFEREFRTFSPEIHNSLCYLIDSVAGPDLAESYSLIYLNSVLEAAEKNSYKEFCTASGGDFKRYYVKKIGASNPTAFARDPANQKKLTELFAEYTDQKKSWTETSEDLIYTFGSATDRKAVVLQKINELLMLSKTDAEKSYKQTVSYYKSFAEQGRASKLTPASRKDIGDHLSTYLRENGYNPTLEYLACYFGNTEALNKCRLKWLEDLLTKTDKNILESSEDKLGVVHDYEHYKSYDFTVIPECTKSIQRLEEVSHGGRELVTSLIPTVGFLTERNVFDSFKCDANIKQYFGAANYLAVKSLFEKYMLNGVDNAYHESKDVLCQIVKENNPLCVQFDKKALDKHNEHIRDRSNKASKANLEKSWKFHAENKSYKSLYDDYIYYLGIYETNRKKVQYDMASIRSDNTQTMECNNTVNLSLNETQRSNAKEAYLFIETLILNKAKENKTAIEYLNEIIKNFDSKSNDYSEFVKQCNAELVNQLGLIRANGQNVSEWAALLKQDLLNIINKKSFHLMALCTPQGNILESEWLPFYYLTEVEKNDLLGLVKSALDRTIESDYPKTRKVLLSLKALIETNKKEVIVDEVKNYDFIYQANAKLNTLIDAEDTQLMLIDDYETPISEENLQAYNNKFDAIECILEESIIAHADADYLYRACSKLMMILNFHKNKVEQSLEEFLYLFPKNSENPLPLCVKHVAFLEKILAKAKGLSAMLPVDNNSKALGILRSLQERSANMQGINLILGILNRPRESNAASYLEIITPNILQDSEFINKIKNINAAADFAVKGNITTLLKKISVDLAVRFKAMENKSKNQWDRIRDGSIPLLKNFESRLKVAGIVNEALQLLGENTHDLQTVFTNIINEHKQVFLNLFLVKPNGTVSPLDGTIQTYCRDIIGIIKLFGNQEQIAAVNTINTVDKTVELSKMILAFGNKNDIEAIDRTLESMKTSPSDAYKKYTASLYGSFPAETNDNSRENISDKIGLKFFSPPAIRVEQQVVLKNPNIDAPRVNQSLTINS